MASVAQQNRYERERDETARMLAVIAPSKCAATAIGALEHDGLMIESHHSARGQPPLSDSPSTPTSFSWRTVCSLQVSHPQRAAARRTLLEREGQERLTASVRSVSLEQMSVRRPSGEYLARRALMHRERQIIALVAAGFTNAQIPERRCLAERAINTHRASVFHRRGLTSRRRATAVLASDDEFRRSPSLRSAN
jgi:DNA-binding CsgD family transcriptional regulator